MKTFFNSKLFSVGELIYNMIIINIMIIIGSLGIVTIGTSICSGIEVIKNLKRGSRNNLLKSFIEIYIKYLIKGLILTTIFIIWVIIFQYLIINYTQIAIMPYKVLIVLAAIEILMSLLAGFIIMMDNKKKNIIQMIAEGFVHFHCHFTIYFISLVGLLLSFLILSYSMVLLPCSISGSIYLIILQLESRNLKSVGDNPTTFLNVFEKTN